MKCSLIAGFITSGKLASILSNSAAVSGNHVRGAGIPSFTDIRYVFRLSHAH